MDDKEFRLDRAQYIGESKSGPRRVLLEWRYLGSEGGRTRRAGGIYRAELNPANSWQVDRTEVRIPARSDWGGWTEEVSYQPEGGEVPFPSRVRVAFSRAKMTVEIVHTFEQPTTCQRSEAEFFLPNYGISESRPWDYRELCGGRDGCCMVEVCWDWDWWYYLRGRGFGGSERNCEDQ